MTNSTSLWDLRGKAPALCCVISRCKHPDGSLPDTPKKFIDYKVDRIIKECDILTAENGSPERYEYIDFLKGVAAIGIVGIHTAFFSGSAYVPLWFRDSTLFLDVPFFFYLSGWGSSFRRSNIVRTAKSLGLMWEKWVCFISVLALFCLISGKLPHTFEGVSDLRELVNNYMFNVSFPGFPVVSGSIWFIQ